MAPEDPHVGLIFDLPKTDWDLLRINNALTRIVVDAVQPRAGPKRLVDPIVKLLWPNPGQEDFTWDTVVRAVRANALGPIDDSLVDEMRTRIRELYKLIAAYQTTDGVMQDPNFKPILQWLCQAGIFCVGTSYSDDKDGFAMCVMAS